MKERKRERDVLLLCLFFQVGGHTLGPIAHRLPHYFTPFAHTAKAEVTRLFILKFLCVVTLVDVFVGLCVGVWFYGTVWLIRVHRSFYLPHSSALPSKHMIIKISRLSACDNAQKYRQRQNNNKNKWNSVMGVEFDEFQWILKIVGKVVISR